MKRSSMYLKTDELSRGVESLSVLIEPTLISYWFASLAYSCPDGGLPLMTQQIEQNRGIAFSER